MIEGGGRGREGRGTEGDWCGWRHQFNASASEWFKKKIFCCSRSSRNSRNIKT